MTLSITQLRDQMARRYSDVEQIDDSVIRFTRKSRDRPFAIYYVDINPLLPETPQALTSYQDRVIGQRYFAGKKSLQWSNYLYFVVSDDQSRSSAVRKARELIEVDRTYARKFVITEDELESAFEPRAIAQSEEVPGANILSVWLAKLAEASLIAAVLSEESIPSKLAVIESDSDKSEPNSIPIVSRPTDQRAPFLRSVELTNYRKFPTRRTFRFGAVNLFEGANGSGKTSLLEAIELVYCGRTKRNPDATDQYTITATFEDGNTERATPSRPQGLFRERNLSWYGQAEIRTNHLYRSFAQFNFLDTDAAVSLANSTAELERDLSKLLVGPQVSKMWAQIERMDVPVSSRLRELTSQQSQITDEMDALDAQLQEVEGVERQSDSILIRLEDMVRRAGWGVASGDKGELAGVLIGSLSELDPLARQAVEFGWARSPVSLAALEEYCTEAQKLCDKADADIAELEDLRNDERQLGDATRRCHEALALVMQAQRVVDAGLPARVAVLRKLQSTITTNADLLAGCDDQLLAVLMRQGEGLTVAEFASHQTAARASAEEALIAAKNEHTKSTELRSRSSRLVQELREIAVLLIQNGAEPDECPLCHTQFGPDELVKHMYRNVDGNSEAQSHTNLARLRQREDELRAAAFAESASGWLSQFCERLNIANTISIEAASSSIRDTQLAIEDAERSSDALKQEIHALESRGLSVAELGELHDRSRALGHLLPDWTNESLEQSRATIEQERKKTNADLDSKRTKADILQKAVEADLTSPNSDVQGLKTVVRQRKERWAVAEGLRQRLSDMSGSLPWRRDRPFSELLVELETIQKVATEFQAALSRERQASAVLVRSTKRKEELEHQLAELSPRIARLISAKTALDNIRSEHSLEGAMQTALRRNRSTIEAIFGRIHSPPDFSGLGEQLGTLVRKLDGTEASLSQISTGQRSAFALSIFLAQNSQLRTAPPVLVIDDPIAHFDDLNSLSFLDYLREIVLAGGRQVFFATANHKLAELFSRKFDFLGTEEFCRIELQR